MFLIEQPYQENFVISEVVSVLGQEADVMEVGRWRFDGQTERLKKAENIWKRRSDFKGEFLLTMICSAGPISCTMEVLKMSRIQAHMNHIFHRLINELDCFLNPLIVGKA